MFQLLVIADDYTGALDTGIQFASRGISTRLYLYNQFSKDLLESINESVILVDTESRHVSPDVAADRVKSAARIAQQCGCRYFFKKTDSTLRGNLGAELSALQDICQSSQLYFAPAYPALGRTTVQGVQYVYGVPLAQTDFAADPFNPIRESNVSNLLTAQTSRRIRHAKPSQVLPSVGIPEIIVVDGACDEDLHQAADALSAAGQLTCLAGCAGFAAALPRVLSLPISDFHWKPRAGGMLLVCGSVHPQSVLQCRYAVECCNYHDYPLDLSQLLSMESACDSLIRSIRNTLSTGGNALLRVPGGREQLALTASAAESLGLSVESLPFLIAQRLGTIAAQCLQDLSIRAMTVFGGDTLMGLSMALRSTSVRPVAELLPGIVLSQMDTSHGSVDLITKAGAFGDKELMAQIDNRFQHIKKEASQ